MITPLAIQIVLGIYAVLLAVGGVMGYVKAGSKPSLIAGLASAALTALGVALSFASPVLGLGLGLFVAVALVYVFGRRFMQTRKVMPAGMLAIVSSLVAFLAALALAG
ncbi:TMEM14 family protein [Aquisphaera insulae]|uniref:TMEM14 family protein n=1 Tax=Aquisphaera insulae TaxID=2712864 RepID=UPI0013ED3CDB|nr:TMEM14 family protein [Aquisphaera insulae]